MGCWECYAANAQRCLSMNPNTAQALLDINRTFYRECADAFAATRTRPWSAFERVLSTAPTAPMQALRVLDVGCGNGRFAHTLLTHHPGRVERYLGVDASLPLLALARQPALPFPSEFQHHDLWAPLPRLHPDGFNLVVAFGLLHHIPGRQARRALALHLTDQISPQGRLVLSFFRYERSVRLQRRRVAPPVPDPSELEPGDYLLPFGSTGRLRYCHCFDDAEITELSHLPGMKTLDLFSPSEGSDHLNDYLVLERPS